ncbi:hypothetical protein BGZ94_005219 [Podila epigama]|nr:hypothetical protein BGZ94_005219 [Podila epigama]
MLVPGSEPDFSGPGPVPALTLPSLRDLDKSLGGAETDSAFHHHGTNVHAHQPKSQSSDPHLHRHYQQQQQQHQHQQGHSIDSHYKAMPHLPSPSPSSSDPSAYQYGDQRSRYSSSAGSLPDLYMSSPSAAMSTTTSTVSKADTLSTMDYLQENHPHGNSLQAHDRGHDNKDQDNQGHSQDRDSELDRDRGYEQDHDVEHDQEFDHNDRSISNNAVNNDYADNNSHSTASKEDATLLKKSSNSSTSNNDNSKSKNNNSPDTDASANNNTTETDGATTATTTTKKKSSEQGRNSVKRAAQNRAAQRAFRQRKDLYVRELERKADLLPAAELEVANLTNRVRMLEAALAAAEAEVNARRSASGILPPPIVPLDSPLGPSAGPAQGPGAPSPLPSHMDRDWNWDREQRFKHHPHEPTGALPPPPDAYGHNPSPAVRRIIPRHSSSHQLRQAYNSPPPSSYGPPKHISQSYFQAGSDQEFDASRPQRRLRRHPSESSLNLRMHVDSRFSTSPGSDSFSPYRPNDTTRMETTSSLVSSGEGGCSSGQFSVNSILKKPTLPVPASARQLDHHISRPYPSSPLTPTQERSTHHVHSDPNASPSSIHHSLHHHPSSLSNDQSKKRPSDGVASWGGQDLYRSAPDSDNSHSYHQVKKQSSWSSLSDQYRIHSIKKQQSLGSLSERRLLHQQNSTAIRDAQYFRESGRGVPSGSNIGVNNSMGGAAGTSGSGSGSGVGAGVGTGAMNSPTSALSPVTNTFTFSPKLRHTGYNSSNSNTNNSSNSVTLPPVSLLSLASPSSRPRDLTEDDLPEPSPLSTSGEQRHFSHHYHRPTLHHRASTNSLTATRRSERRPSWPENGLGFSNGHNIGGGGGAGGMVTASPEMPSPSSEGRFNSSSLPRISSAFSQGISSSAAAPGHVRLSPITPGNVLSSAPTDLGSAHSEQGSPFSYSSQHSYFDRHQHPSQQKQQQHSGFRDTEMANASMSPSPSPPHYSQLPQQQYDAKDTPDESSAA